LPYMVMQLLGVTFTDRANKTTAIVSLIWIVVFAGKRVLSAYFDHQASTPIGNNIIISHNQHKLRRLCQPVTRPL